MIYLYIVSKYFECGQTRNEKFRLFQTEKVCRRQLKFDENDIQFANQEENTVVKGKIARYEQFLLFSQCFQKTCIGDM